MKWLPWFIVGLAAVTLLFLVFWAQGSAVVLDETGEVAGAVVIDESGERHLQRLPGGTFYAMPASDGIIEVRCRGGATARAGYVTPHLHTWVRVEGDVPCGRIVELL